MTTNSGRADPVVLEFTTPVGDRPHASFRLTQEEADAMIARGFVFAVYDKRDMRFELEPPFAQSGNAAAGTWTFRQVAR